MERPFITVGFASFALLIPLAVTSTTAMIKRLGGKWWRRLHRLVYAIAIGGVVHYLWLVKADIQQPLLYGGILAVLLIYRFGTCMAAACWPALLHCARLRSEGERCYSRAGSTRSANSRIDRTTLSCGMPPIFIQAMICCTPSTSRMW